MPAWSRELIIFLIILQVATAVFTGEPLSAKAPKDWPEHGPWIVSVNYGNNDVIVAKARESHKSYFQDKRTEDIIPFKVKDSFRDLDGLNAVVLEGVRAKDLLLIPEVVAVYPDLPVYPAAYTWGTDRIDQINLPLSGTYNPAFKGCGVDIYVIDSGIDTNHVEFTPVSGTSRTVANIFNQFGAVTSNTDGFGHGTHCAGIAGGNNVGTSPCANIYGLKIFDNSGGSGFSSYIISALSLVKQRHLANPNAKSVVSMSLGGICTPSCAGNIVNAKVAELTAVGIAFSVAATNDNGADACLAFPASAPEAVTVAASDQYDNFASYSDTGPCVGIIAPGSYISSACTGIICGGENAYLMMSGTSMATPVVAGLLAQLLQKKPSATVADLKRALYCDGAKGLIQGIFARSFGTTVNLLAQAPFNDGIFGTCGPTSATTAGPSSVPALSAKPASRSPSFKPAKAVPSRSPSRFPTCLPSLGPSSEPSSFPSTETPSFAPSSSPSQKPSRIPSSSPSKPVKPSPSAKSTRAPTAIATLSPSREPSAVSSLIPTASPSPDTTTLICQDGGFCRTNADCVPGNKCVGNYPGFTKCQGDSTTFRGGNCLNNWGLQCTDDSQCCDPGAFCGPGPYRVCQQPGLNSGLCLNPPNFPTMQPISFSPSSASKDYSRLICQYGGFCFSNSDCVPGNKCTGQYPSFTQCAADPSTYKVGNCIAVWGQCQDSGQCCDPGALCLGTAAYKACQQPSLTSGLCLNPAGFVLRAPTAVPTLLLTAKPTSVPSLPPTISPSTKSTSTPSSKPTTFSPSVRPSATPSLGPTISPSFSPSTVPSMNPTAIPSIVPSASPSTPPTTCPSSKPSIPPTYSPSASPTSTSPTRKPTKCPSAVPSRPPTFSPSTLPSILPTVTPTVSPTFGPSVTPSKKPSSKPSVRPSLRPSSVPTLSQRPSIRPTALPSCTPSAVPTVVPSRSPSSEPSVDPSVSPSLNPSLSPSLDPSSSPSFSPSLDPTADPATGSSPSVDPSVEPSMSPSGPSAEPSGIPPTEEPSVVPTGPTIDPSAGPTNEPVAGSGDAPSMEPTNEPANSGPSLEPTVEPSGPVSEPTVEPSGPISEPTVDPSGTPSAEPA